MVFSDTMQSYAEESFFFMYLVDQVEVFFFEHRTAN